MTNASQKFHYEAGSVRVFSFEPSPGWLEFMVTDDVHYRIRFHPDREGGCYTAGIDAEYSDERPGGLADYTRSHDGSASFAPGEVSISDDGLLAAMARQNSAAHVDIRSGWTARLPIEFVEPVREAIALVENCLVEGGNTNEG